MAAFKDNQELLAGSLQVFSVVQRERWVFTGTGAGTGAKIGHVTDQKRDRVQGCLCEQKATRRKELDAETTHAVSVAAARSRPGQGGPDRQRQAALVFVSAMPPWLRCLFDPVRVPVYPVHPCLFPVFVGFGQRPSSLPMTAHHQGAVQGKPPQRAANLTPQEAALTNMYDRDMAARERRIARLAASSTLKLTLIITLKTTKGI